MSKIERFQGDVKAFASNAQGLERTVFGGTTQANDLTSQVTAAFLRGWGIVGPSEHPSLEDFNAAMYAMSQFIAYQHQVGVPEWHAEQEYHAGSVCTHGGVSYQSLNDENIGNEPPSAKWTPVLTAKNGGEYFQPKNANLTALAGLAGAANRLPYFTGANALALTALTAVGRDIIGKSSVADVLTYLGIGEASLTQRGIVQLSNTLNSDSQTTAPTSYALGELYRAYIAAFPKRTFLSNDFIRIPDTPGGLVIQWISVPSTSFTAFDTNVVITLPVAFTNQHLIAYATCVNATAATTRDGMPQIAGRDRGTVTVKQSLTGDGQTLSDVAVLCIGF